MSYFVPHHLFVHAHSQLVHKDAKKNRFGNNGKLRDHKGSGRDESTGLLKQVVYQIVYT